MEQETITLSQCDETAPVVLRILSATITNQTELTKFVCKSYICIWKQSGAINTTFRILLSGKCAFCFPHKEYREGTMYYPAIGSFTLL
jgi:hypothetical protein